jgi:hypothetical protein
MSEDCVLQKSKVAHGCSKNSAGYSYDKQLLQQYPEQSGQSARRAPDADIDLDNFGAVITASHESHFGETEQPKLSRDCRAEAGYGG